MTSQRDTNAITSLELHRSIGASFAVTAGKMCQVSSEAAEEGARREDEQTRGVLLVCEPHTVCRCVSLKSCENNSVGKTTEFQQQQQVSLKTTLHSGKKVFLVL